MKMLKITGSIELTEDISEEALECINHKLMSALEDIMCFDQVLSDEMTESVEVEHIEVSVERD